MTTFWNFRQILNIYPESASFSCVAARGDESTRCPNKRPLLSDLDLSEASTILDNMDSCESLKASYDYLLDLAHLTLCIEHSESGLEQVAMISGRWQDKIIMHMKKEVASTARPKTRRDFARKRGPSASLLTVLAETREEQIHSPAINVPALKTKKPSRIPRPPPTRSVSNKISSLISEVGFHDASNEKYNPGTKLRHANTTSGESAPRLLRRDTPGTAPLQISTIDAEWANQQLMSLLSKTESQLVIKDVPTPTSATRERSSTTSSTESTHTTSSKTSKFTESLDGSSAPTSAESSEKNSPVIGSIKQDTRFPKPSSIRLPQPGMKKAVPSPERPLPTFDFGIFTNLPLPPGHKEELSPQNKQFPDEWESEFKVPRLPLPPALFDFTSTANTRPTQMMEKLLRTKSKPTKKPTVKQLRKGPIMRHHSVLQSRSDSDGSGNVLDNEQRLETQDSEPVETLTAMVVATSVLPQHDLVDPIGTSWMSPLLRQGSRKSSVSTSGLARRPSRLSRTLSRTLSRSSSTRSKAATIAEDHNIGASPSLSNERIKVLRRQTDNPRGLTRKASTKRETIPLDKLIKMSHELADRLDGVEAGGHVEVLPATSYKYHLPSTSLTRPVPELRWSKLFTAVEPEAFLNESPFFRLHPKPINSRSKSVGNATVAQELKLAHPGNEVSLPISEMKIKAVREEEDFPFPTMHIEKKPTVKGELEVCIICRNTAGIWGQCDCFATTRRVSKGSAKRGDSVSEKRISVVPTPMEMVPPIPRQSTMRRIRKRGMTLRRIRTRVVRALTV